ncbi:MAG: hypothetical protein KAY59_07920 [Acidobacteria bacterium]|nr:hypothetical protein [Acidobacteriota bacterium]
MAEWVGIVVGVLSVAVAGLVAWIWQLWSSHNAHKLQVSEHYIRRAEYQSLKAELTENMQALQRAQQQEYALLVQVAAKVGVPVNTAGPWAN